MAGAPSSRRVLTGCAEVLRSGADLIVPVVCGGCSIPGTPWCDDCARTLADDPVALTPRVEVGASTWALGRYRGSRRAALLAAKEHGRRDLCAPLGEALARGIVALARWGELPDASELTLVPAPTRRSTARRRGGDHVTAIARCAAAGLGPHVRVVPALVTAGWARDSAGLDARERVANLAGAIRSNGSRDRIGGAVLLVDDILTTGATAAESVRELSRHGVTVHAVLVVAAA